MKDSLNVMCRSGRTRLSLMPCAERLWRTVGLAGTLAYVLGACGGDGQNPGDAPKVVESAPTSARSAPTLWVLEDDKGTYMRRGFTLRAAAEPPAAGIQSNELPTNPAIGTRSHAGSAVIKPKGTPYIELSPPPSSPVDLVALRAARQCAAEDAHTRDEHILDSISQDWRVSQLWYSSDITSTCDRQLWAKENLVCTASKLLQIAESPAPIEWAPIPRPDGSQYPKWVIPPQSTHARVVARETALNVLAMVQYLSESALSNPSPFSPHCGDLYNALPGSIDHYNTNRASWCEAVGEDQHIVYPTVFRGCASGTNAEVERMLSARRMMDTRVLSNASHLLEKIVRGSVTDDLSGAENARGLDGDPVAGNRAAWGETSEYNNYGHALKVLLGRIDNEWTRKAGYSCPTAIDSNVVHGYGPDLDARYELYAADTASRRNALRLVLRTGVILPMGVITATAILRIRDAVEEQALFAQGQDPNQQQSPRSQAFVKALRELSDDDLLFALKWARNLYALVVNESPLSNPTIPAPVESQSRGSSVLWDDLHGVAVKNLDPQLLQYDVMARAGRMQTHGTCATGSTDSMRSVVDLGNGFAGMLERYASQTQDPAVASTARIALAETRRWAGQRILFQTHQAIRPNGYVDQIIAPPLSNAVSAADLVMVYGPAWAADCIAGVRSQCRDTAAISSFVLGRTTGPDAGVNYYNFNYERVSSGDPSFRLYLVDKPTDRTGRVLGALLGPLPYSDPSMVGTDIRYLNWRTLFLVISDYQRQLLNDVMGFRSSSFTCASRATEDSELAKSPAYCIEDVPRNTFVPLTNELTAQGAASEANPESSWRHYLSLAKDAAATADALGQQMITENERLDGRIEAATEEVADICGAYPDMSKVVVDVDGKMEIGGDLEISRCIGSKRIPLSRLGQDRAVSDVKQDLNCSPNPLPGLPNPPDCSTLDKMLTAGIANVTGLNLVKAPPSAGLTTNGESQPVANPCEAVLNATTRGTLATGLPTEALRNATGETWFTRERLSGLLSQLTLEGGRLPVTQPPTPVPASANLALWTLRYNNTVLAQSDGQTIHVLPDCAEPECGLLRTKLTSDLSSLLGIEPGISMSLVHWRLQGILWQLGALQGEVPQGMLTTYIPAASWQTLPTGTVTPRLPTSVVYGTGRMQNGTQGTQLNTDNPDELRRRVGVTLPFVESEWWPRAAEIPAYLTSNFTGAGSLRDYDGDIAPHLRLFRASNESATGADAGRDPAAQVTEMLRQLEGVTCTTPFSGGSAVTADMLSLMHKFTFREHYSGYNHEVAHDVYSIRAQTHKLQLAGEDRTYIAALDYQRRDPGRENVLTMRWAANAGDRWFELTGDTLKATDVTTTQPYFLWESKYLRPGQAIAAWTNTYPPTTKCQAASEIAGSVALACVLNSFATRADRVIPSEPPAINSPASMASFSSWLDRQSKKITEQAGRIILRDLPEDVVAAFSTGTGLGVTGGRRGALLDRMVGQLHEAAGITRDIAGDVGALADRYRTSQLEIEGLSIDLQLAHNAITLQKIQATSTMIKTMMDAASLNAVELFGSTLAAKAAFGASAMVAYQQTLSTLDDASKLQADKNDVQVRIAASNLTTQSRELLTRISKSLEVLYAKANEVRAELTELESLERKAAMTLARAAGMNYVQFDGQTIETYSINSALKAQYDLTGRRYKRALQDAKRLAYLSRLAIEQRLGVKMDRIATRVGGLPPPSSWVSELCTLSGVDYAALKKAGASTAPDAGSSSAVDRGEFADPYIGDFVKSLELFAEYYNIDHPTHEGNDVAVVSLKNDLIPQRSACLQTAPNQLYYSGDLTASDSSLVAGTEAIASVRGWQRGACQPTSQRCVEVPPVASLPTQVFAPGANTAGRNVNWLRWVAPSGSPGAESDMADAVWQDVNLQPGNYVLSWHDQPRDAVGAVADTTVKYRTVIYDSQGNMVAGDALATVASGVGDAGVPNATVDAAAADGAVTTYQGWSDRRVLRFVVSNEGRYRVAFRGNDLPNGRGVLLGNVQLEWVSDTRQGPTAYIETTANRDYLESNCEQSQLQFQKRFRYDCNADGRCFYELIDPVELDTTTIGTAETGIHHQFAGYNANYRHLRIALNLVGSGVVDCGKPSSAPDCAGSGFVKYSLVHDAHEVPVINAEKDTQCFNFGSGSINDAKALAAERKLTMPLGNTDRALTEYTAFSKPEFAGRPLDGRYRLRIWDHPALRWDHLDDIQLLMTYRYWAPISLDK